VLRTFRAQVGDINVAELIALHGDDFHSRHHGAGGIRPVRGGGNKTNVAMRFIAIGEVGANDKQARELTLRAGVGLK
jgi:hypothetical protein